MARFLSLSDVKGSSVSKSGDDTNDSKHNIDAEGSSGVNDKKFKYDLDGNVHKIGNSEANVKRYLAYLNHASARQFTDKLHARQTKEGTCEVCIYIVLFIKTFIEKYFFWRGRV